MTNLVYKQGDSDTLTETITGLTSLIGYQAKMYIADKSGTAIDTLTGSINGLVITYHIVNEKSKSYPLGVHNFETKIWDSSDHVYTPHRGKIIIEPAIENDPS